MNALENVGGLIDFAADTHSEDATTRALLDELQSRKLADQAVAKW
jgi:hypothetical protein